VNKNHFNKIYGIIITAHLKPEKKRDYQNESLHTDLALNHCSCVAKQAPTTSPTTKKNFTYVLFFTVVRFV
jgi:hypothetical protein